MSNTGRIDQIHITSEALRDNPLGDPHERPLHVYLPPGYDDDPAQRYPVLLMLSAHGGTGPALLNWRAWDERIDQQLDRLIGSGACPPHIMILPDTWTSFGGTLHLNTPAMGNYGDYLIDEVIPLVDATYRTLPTYRSRGILGRSSGGYGAIYHAMTRPGVFNAVADHAGDCYFEFSYIPQLAPLHMHLMRFGGLDGWIADTKLNTPKSQAFWEISSAVTFAATFAINSSMPHGFDLPVDMETGALREDVWRRCLDFDPIRLVRQPAHAAALRNIKEVFIDAGVHDEYNLQVGARLLSRVLHEQDIPHTYEEFLGGHRGTHFRYDVSVPRLVKALWDR